MLCVVLNYCWSPNFYPHLSFSPILSSLVGWFRLFLGFNHCFCARNTQTYASIQNFPWSLLEVPEGCFRLHLSSLALPQTSSSRVPVSVNWHHCSSIHSLKNPNLKFRCPPPLPCQISHQVSLVIPLLTPKAVPFSPSLLFYFGSLYSLLNVSHKPTDKVLRDLLPSNWESLKFYLCCKPLPKLELQLNQTTCGFHPEWKNAANQVWDLVDQGSGEGDVKGRGLENEWDQQHHFWERWSHLERKWCP